MNHFLDIFKQRSIVKAYASCRNGSNKDLFAAFQLELSGILDLVCAECEQYRNTDKQLYGIGNELLIALSEVVNVFPIFVEHNLAQATTVIGKLDEAYRKTSSLVSHINTKPKQLDLFER